MLRVKACPEFGVVFIPTADGKIFQFHKIRQGFGKLLRSLGNLLLTAFYAVLESLSVCFLLKVKLSKTVEGWEKLLKSGQQLVIDAVEDFFRGANQPFDGVEEGFGALACALAQGAFLGG